MFPREDYQQSHPGENFLEFPEEYATIRAVDNSTAVGVHQIYVHKYLHNDENVLNPTQCKFILL